MKENPRGTGTSAAVAIIAIIAIAGIVGYFVLKVGEEGGGEGSGGQPLPPLSSENISIPRNFEWEDHLGEVWTWNIDIENSRYEYYQNLSHRAYSTNDYLRFVTFEDGQIKEMADRLKGVFSDPEDAANCILAFVQAGFPYTPEDREYWRYPVETLVDNGDCEDKAVLFTAIMKAAGYDVALIVFDDHAMAGVVLWNEPEYGTQESFHWFESDGKRYYTCETTAEGWRAGDLPEEYDGKSALVLVVESAPTLEFELKSWEVVGGGGVAELKLTCYSPVSIDLYLSDPNLNQIDWDYISDTAMEDGSEISQLRLAGYGETPIAGTYSLVVKGSYPEETLYTKEFTFNGANLEVISCTPSWEYRPYLGYYSLDGLSVEVRNDGDLPTFISKIEVTIAGEEDEGIFLCSESGVLPDQSKTLEDTFYISEIPSGTHTMSLTLKDYGGNILATYSTTVTLTTPEPTAYFELKSWRVFDDGGVPKLEVVCYSTESINLYLSDPNLNQTAWDFISDTAMEDGSETSGLRLAGYKETPMAGTYNLVVKSSYPEQTLYTGEFTFSGADLSVTSCTPTFQYWPYLGYYSLNELNVGLTNEGDLPAYVSRIWVDIAGQEGYAVVLEGGVALGQSKTLSESFFMTDIPSGTQMMNITLKDYAGNIVATYSTTVTPSE